MLIYLYTVYTIFGLKLNLLTFFNKHGLTNNEYTGIQTQQ